jgi:hypothetical protein
MVVGTVFIADLRDGLIKVYGINVCMLALKIWHYMKNKLKQGCGVTKDGKYNVIIEEALSEFQQHLFDLTMPQMTKSAK